MNWSIGDRVIITIGPEDSQNAFLQAVDGLEAEVSMVYENPYEPGVKRFEVMLTTPTEFDGEKVKKVDGLYEDNLERLQMESKALNFGRWIAGVKNKIC